MSFEFDIESQQYVDKNKQEYLFADISQDKAKKNEKSMSVSDALLIAKTGLESIKLNIIGEISEISNKPGYKAVYFTIKDEKSALPCLMWKNRFLSCDVDLKPGDLVEVKGKFSLYAAKGRMNFDVSFINLAGEGELRMQVARLAKKLQAAGYTNAEKKKKIPKIPKKVGLVTSPRGAVVHDVLRTLRRRMPITQVVFAGCAVEGNDAPQKMIEAIDCVDKYGVDVILLVRGGGSFEDLMPFNNEDLAMKIVNLNTPIVSGIGHEPDTTIVDLVSDFRASTPTAAAEAVSLNLIDIVSEYLNKLLAVKKAMFNRLNLTKEKIESIASRPIFMDVRQLYSAEFQNLDYLQDKMFAMLSTVGQNEKQNLEHLFDKYNNLLQNSTKNYDSLIKIAAAKLHDKSPLVVLSRGYSITRDKNAKLVKSVEQVSAEDNIDIELYDGKLSATVYSLVKKDKLKE